MFNFKNERKISSNLFLKTVFRSALVPYHKGFTRMVEKTTLATGTETLNENLYVGIILHTAGSPSTRTQTVGMTDEDESACSGGSPSDGDNPCKLKPLY